MNELGMRIAHSKRRGEWAELRFMERAAEHGLCVSKPWGDTALYDFVVETAGNLLRVQVKSTFSMRHGAYIVRNRNSRGTYPPGSFDFVAAYVIPLDLWYLFPEAIFHQKASVMVFPKSPRSKYSLYLEAWKLLTGGESAGEPQAEPTTTCPPHHGDGVLPGNNEEGTADTAGE